MKKQIISLALCLALATSLVPVAAAAESACTGGADHSWGEATADFEQSCSVCGATQSVDSVSGTTDDDLKWVLTRTGVLTVSGEGECNSLTTMKTYASAVRSVVLEEGVTALSSKAIQLLSGAQTISLPATMEDLDAAALNRYLTGLTAVSVAAGSRALSIVDGVLFDNRETDLLCYPCGLSATDYRVPDGVQCIDGYAFAYAAALEELELPLSLTEVNAGAFFGCTGLTAVSYPGTEALWNGVVRVGKNNDPLEGAAFTYGTESSLSGTCGDDADWVLTADGLLTISGTGEITRQPWPAAAVQEAVLEEGITFIDEEVFAKHTELTKITLPKSLTVVEEGAFYRTAPETVVYKGSEPQWGLVVIGDSNEGLLEADITFDSWLEVAWNSDHTVLSISGMIRDSAWVTAAFYEESGRMAFVKHYAAADVQPGVEISDSQTDLTACSVKVMILDAYYAPVGLPYELGIAPDVSTVWLYATEDAYIDGGKKAEKGTLLFSDGSKTYEMETDDTDLGVWDLGQAYTLTMDDDGTVLAAELSGESTVGQCILLHVNADEDDDSGSFSFEFGDLSGAFDADTIPCLVLEPGCDGEPGTMTAEAMADLVETGVSHIYRGVDKDTDGDIDYLLVQHTMYGMVAEANEKYLLLEDNRGDALMDAANNTDKWYLEDTLDMDEIPEEGAILKLTWSIESGLYEVEVLEAQQDILVSYDRRRARFEEARACYYAEEGWVDTDLLENAEEGDVFLIITDEELLIKLEKLTVTPADV